MVTTEIEVKENIVKGRLEYLLKDEGLPLVAEAMTETDAYKKTSEDTPEIIILDCFIHNKEGIEIVNYIKDKCPSTKMILITEQLEEEIMIRSFEAGVKGYLLKKENHEELLLAINKIKNGDIYICSEASYNMLDRIKEIVNKNDNQMPLSINLSGRELEVLQLISDGLTNNEIAEKIFTSRRTVETHRKTLIEKTKTKNTAALIKYAMINRLIN
jgi:DNA-binding NarL/FixJ family response regulator